MKNTLIDIDLNTMIGNFPEIYNVNSSYINSEFNSIESVVNINSGNINANIVSASTGIFTKNITVGNSIIDSSLISNYKKINNEIINLNTNDSSIDIRVTKLETAVKSLNLKDNNGVYYYGSSYITENNIIGDSISSKSIEYDMSNFFTTNLKGSIENIKINELYNKCIYRMIEDIKIPLRIGTIVSGGKLRMIVYHDHINSSGSEKYIERVYSIIVDNATGIIQYGSPNTIVIR